MVLDVLSRRLVLRLRLGSNSVETKISFAIVAFVFLIVAQTGAAFWTISSMSEKVSQIERRLIGFSLRSGISQRQTVALTIGQARLETKIDVLTDYLIPKETARAR